MSRGFYEEYKQKLMSAHEAASLVKDGDWVDFSAGIDFPYLLDKALAKRKGELKDVKIRGILPLRPIACVEEDPFQESFTYNSWHCSAYDRKLCDLGRAYYIPMTFRNAPEYYRRYIDVDVAMISVAPMDEKGYFSFSALNCTNRAIVDRAKTVILEVDENLPPVYGGIDDCVHISEVDGVVEGEHPPLSALPVAEPTQVDKTIAGLIVPHIRDGAAIQLGIGGMPNSVGNLIAESDLKHLGMHTELMSDGYIDLYESGIMDDSLKNINRNKGVFSLALGSQRLYDFIRDNRGIISCPIDYVNKPEIMGELDNLISINSCVAVDIYGQVCSESSGTRHISGTGGQLDFSIGSFMSKGGKGFICMSSTYKDKEGNLKSKILPKFVGGDIITTPRTQAFYLVSEYGVANLAGLSTWERAEAIISLAHPDFRDELIDAAQSQKIWRKSNRIR